MASGRKKKKKKRRAVFLTVLLVIIVILAAAAAFMYKKYSPSKEETDYSSYYELEEEGEFFVVFNNEKLEENGYYIDGHAYISYDAVHDHINSRFYWDPAEEVLRYTLSDALISAGPDTEEYTVGKEKQTADYTICMVIGDTMYMAVEFAAEYTDISWSFYEEPGRLVISDEWGTIEYTKMKKSSAVRQKGGVKSPILAEVSKNDLVRVLEEGDNWTKVCTQDGFIGYVMNSALGRTEDVTTESEFAEEEYTHITRDYAINLAWHQVTNMTANSYVSDVIADAEGINVISPTWFYLDDDDGSIASLASYDYVSYCHAQGIEVWALVSNLENSDVDTSAVLNTTSSRDNLVNQIIAAAIQYDLDGINVDFESLDSDIGDGFIQFIRELSLKCANNDIVLSVDNYVPSSYTTMYYREEQANFADYLILMAYDEHYSGSEEGSVASLSFVTQGVEDTLAEGVPAEQLILGIPFYTRIWAITENEDGTYSVTSEAVDMSEVDTRIAANGASTEWLEDCGQYYTEYENDGVTYKIWIEDQNSIEEKLKVYQEYGLAGAAFWKLGFEKSSVWDTIAEYLQ